MSALVFFEIVLFSMLFAIPLRTVQHLTNTVSCKIKLKDSLNCISLFRINNQLISYSVIANNVNSYKKSASTRIAPDLTLSLNIYLNFHTFRIKKKIINAHYQYTFFIIKWCHCILCNNNFFKPISRIYQ